MIYSNNPFGQSREDFDEKTSGDRIGRRIRRIREEKEPKCLSQIWAI